MPEITAATQIVTQINVFTVPEGRQQPLIDLLVESAKYASTTPGWISPSVHRSYDGTRVVNYAQTESLEAAQRVIERLQEGGCSIATRDSVKRIRVSTKWSSPWNADGLPRSRGHRRAGYMSFVTFHRWSPRELLQRSRLATCRRPSVAARLPNVK
jgi:hypothetical protein